MGLTLLTNIHRCVIQASKLILFPSPSLLLPPQEQIELTRVGDGVSHLKQIAVDMNEVRADLHVYMCCSDTTLPRFRPLPLRRPPSYHPSPTSCPPSLPPPPFFQNPQRVKEQNAELDPMAGQLTDYREDIGEVNKRLKAAARKGKRWGSFGRNLLCMLLLVGQIIALGYLIQFVIQENRKH